MSGSIAPRHAVVNRKKTGEDLVPHRHHRHARRLDNVGDARPGAAHGGHVRTPALRRDQQRQSRLEGAHRPFQQGAVILTAMHRLHTVQAHQLSLRGPGEHVRGADDFQNIRPERGREGRIKKRNVIDRHNIRPPVRHILAASDRHLSQNMEQAAEHRPQNRAADPKAQGGAIFIHRTRPLLSRRLHPRSSYPNRG